MDTEYVIGQTKRGGSVTVSLELRDKAKGLELSICGAVWKAYHSDIDMGGQCLESLASEISHWLVPKQTLADIVKVWDRWHLNDMRPGCEHQRDWPTTEKVKLYTYRLNSETIGIQHRIKSYAMRELEITGSVSLPTHDKHMFGLPFEIVTDGDADISPDPIYYALHKTEEKALGWLRVNEHPKGLLMKPCPICSYRYGSEWKFEPLPEGIVRQVRHWMETIPVFTHSFPYYRKQVS